MDKWLKVGSRKLIRQSQIDGAKLGLFAKIDQLPIPERRALSEFLYGINEEMFQKRRIELLDVTKDDIVAATVKYLSKDTPKVAYKDVVFGNADEGLLGSAFEKAGWKVDRFATKVSENEIK